MEGKLILIHYICTYINNDSPQHEKGSIDMLDHLIEENELKLEEYDITREDIIFVKEQIVGYPIDDKNRKKPSGDVSKMLTNFIVRLMKGIIFNNLH